jgi:hypothetical protein
MAPGPDDSFRRVSTFGWSCQRGRAEDDAPMKKRLLAAFLWFYAWWYAGAIMADFVGVSPLLGPIVGVAAAVIFVGDPRRIIWATRDTVAAQAATQPNPLQDPI